MVLSEATHMDINRKETNLTLPCRLVHQASILSLTVDETAADV